MEMEIKNEYICYVYQKNHIHGLTIYCFEGQLKNLDHLKKNLNEAISCFYWQMDIDKLIPKEWFAVKIEGTQWKYVCPRKTRYVKISDYYQKFQIIPRRVIKSERKLEDSNDEQSISADIEEEKELFTDESEEF